MDNARDITRLFLERDSKVPIVAQDFMDRALLRVFSSTSLLSTLTNAKIVNGDDGGCVLEFDFSQLPEDTVSDAVRLVGGDLSSQVKVIKFKDRRGSHTGLKLPISKDQIDSATKTAKGWNDVV